MRVEDGTYSERLPGAIVGDVFERDIEGHRRICIDQGPAGIVAIDPVNRELVRLKASMTGKLSFEGDREGFAKRVANLFKK